MTDFKKYPYADPLNNGFERMKKAHRLPKLPQKIGAVFAFKGLNHEGYHFGQIIGGGEHTRYEGYLLAFYDVTSKNKKDIPDLSKAPLLMHPVEDAGRGFLDCFWEIVGDAPIPEHVYPWCTSPDLPEYGLASYLYGTFTKDMSIIPQEPFMVGGVFLSTFTAALLCYCMDIPYGSTADEHMQEESEVDPTDEYAFTKSQIYPFLWRKTLAESEFFDIDKDAPEPFKRAGFALKFNMDKVDDIVGEGGDFKGLPEFKK